MHTTMENATINISPPFLTLRVQDMEPQMDTHEFIAILILCSWVVGLMLFTSTHTHTHTHTHAQHDEIPDDDAQPEHNNEWRIVGLYDLHRAQTLTKEEREAIGHATSTLLYEKIYPSGNVAWRYTVGNTTFYPSERAVHRRRRALFGGSD